MLTINAHEGINGVAFSPDGRRLVTTGIDGTVKIWKASTGEEILNLAGHSARVWDVAFSPDGGRVATFGFDELIKLWDATSGEELLTLTIDGAGPDLAFSPDGRLLAAGGTTARIYILPVEDLIAEAESRLTRSLTAEECQEYLHQDYCPPNP